MPFVDSLRHTADAIHSTHGSFYGSEPYMTHLDMVAKIADGHAGGYDSIDQHMDQYIMLAAAYMHDVLEETNLNYSNLFDILIELLGGDRIKALQTTEIVYALTEPKGRSRKERHCKEYYDGIRAVRHASYIKWCDILANVKYSRDNGNMKKVKMYADEIGMVMDSIDMSEVSSAMLEEMMTALEIDTKH